MSRSRQIVLSDRNFELIEVIWLIDELYRDFVAKHLCAGFRLKTVVSVCSLSPLHIHT